MRGKIALRVGFMNETIKSFSLVWLAKGADTKYLENQVNFKTTVSLSILKVWRFSRTNITANKHSKLNILDYYLVDLKFAWLNKTKYTKRHIYIEE